MRNIVAGRETVIELPLVKLFADANYQRPTDQGRVARMVKDPHQELVGILQVSRRVKGDTQAGMWAIVDGAHRKVFLEGVGMKKALCQEHVGLTPKEEAWLFAEMNRGAKKPTGIRNFIALRFWGGSIEINSIDDICRELGWQVDDFNHKGCIRAVTSLYTASRAGNLEQALSLITRAWGLKPFNDSVLGGTSFWLRRHADDGITPDLLADLLAETSSSGIREVVTHGRRGGGGQEPKDVCDYFDQRLGLLPSPIAIGRATEVRMTKTEVEVRTGA